MSEDDDMESSYANALTNENDELMGNHSTGNEDLEEETYDEYGVPNSYVGGHSMTQSLDNSPMGYHSENVNGRNGNHDEIRKKLRRSDSLSFPCFNDNNPIDDGPSKKNNELSPDTATGDTSQLFKYRKAKYRFCCKVMTLDAVHVTGSASE